MERRPLEGVTILDFGWVIAAPYGTRLLRDMGARVVRLETGTRVDPARLDTRRPGSDWREEGGWAYYDNNHCKIDLCLNLKSEKGKEILYRLIPQVDVVVSNYAPRAFHKLGIDYETLKEKREDIIVINASGLGDTGPYRDYATYAPIMQCLSGMTSLIGYEGEDPFGYSGIAADYIGGIAIAALVASALYHRRKTGEGMFLDMSSTESTLAMMGVPFLQYQINGKLMTPTGDHHYLHQMAPHNCYRCAGEDNWCVIAAGSGEEWENFKNALRSECSWVDDERFSTLEGRLANQSVLDEKISQWTRDQDKKELVKKLQNSGVSAAMVQDGWETLHDEHCGETGYFQTLDFGEGERRPRYVKITNNIIHIASMPPEKYDVLSGQLGSGNEYVLREMLHMKDSEIEAAEQDRAFI